ncbi:hypothetical protein CKK33_16345 [Mucilaginibacter sp. MD40]|uniref:hypothetical protein n=1 Tax=Mucilaginibacter sp. MD40 TaxID=2029590 RepID=UPI000BAC4DC8|nr:hypothetical protein [Mucilaginibacter sp. MD40]PAW94982.1 hypothetical protein CKK33_16345 [Mucilaginibacter sp. MD40]
MYFKQFTKWCLLWIVAVALFASACQKDTKDQAVENKKNALQADSALALNPNDNFLASSGVLTLKMRDTTYTFDASKDSVAFVNMHVEDNRYFGITAINKAHNLSFGISSKGAAADSITKAIAGGQLIVVNDGLHSKQYTLVPYAKPGDVGTLKLVSYMRNDTLAKGSFFTFLAADNDSPSQLYRVDGTFELKLKPKK